LIALYYKLCFVLINTVLKLKINNS